MSKKLDTTGAVRRTIKVYDYGEVENYGDIVILSLTDKFLDTCDKIELEPYGELYVAPKGYAFSHKCKDKLEGAIEKEKKNNYYLIKYNDYIGFDGKYLGFEGNLVYAGDNYILEKRVNYDIYGEIEYVPTETEEYVKRGYLKKYRLIERD